MELTLISGALKNVGDFLIFEKSKNLIKFCIPQSDFLIINRKANFQDYINKINNTKALIICGGPGYGRKFYPTIYPFLRFYNRFEVPIIPLGLGWSGFPLYKPQDFKFTDLSKEYVKKIHSNIPFSSCRDNITKKILNSIGIDNVINTGCPSLIQPDVKNQEFKKSKLIKSIAVSMAQNPLFFKQNEYLLSKIEDIYPNAEKFALFHRGTSIDKYTPKCEAKKLKYLVKISKKLNYSVIDLGYSLPQMNIYEKVDFHVGYRVHGHVYAVSKRIPSFLLWEDGRGQGMSSNLGLRGFPAHTNSFFFKIPQNPCLRYMIFGNYKYNLKVIDKVLEHIEYQIENDYCDFNSVNKRVDMLKKRMDVFFRSVKSIL